MVSPSVGSLELLFLDLNFNLGHLTLKWCYTGSLKVVDVLGHKYIISLLLLKRDHDVMWSPVCVHCSSLTCFSKMMVPSRDHMWLIPGICQCLQVSFWSQLGGRVLLASTG